MKNKNLIIAGIIILALVGIWLYFQFNTSIFPPHPADRGDWSQYKEGTLPSEKLISDDNGNIDTILIKGGPCTGCASSPTYVCKDTNQIASKIKISSPPAGNEGGETRYAIICEDNYWILNNFGSVMQVYGPFENK
jgi:hypothetical protein